MAVVRARDSFTGMVPELGHSPVIPAGTVLDDDDPVVRAHPAMFEPIEAAIARSGAVEQATANPGELRDAVITARKPARGRQTAKKA